MDELTLTKAIRYLKNLVVLVLDADDVLNDNLEKEIDELPDNHASLDLWKIMNRHVENVLNIVVNKQHEIEDKLGTTDLMEERKPKD